MSNLKEEHCALRKENMLLVEGRPGHEAQSLIRYIIAGNSFGALLNLDMKSKAVTHPS